MIETMPQDALNLWRNEGNRLIPENFQVFRSLVDQAKNLTQSGNYEAAAVYGTMAAFYANWRHCGFFVSPELEQVLIAIGQQAIPTRSVPRSKHSPQKILHVSPAVASIGGHSRLIWRWIQQDVERSHSLVLTRQPRREVPAALRDAVKNSGGEVYKLNETVGGLVAWATRLREIAATADLVVLHNVCYDAVPVMAFADREHCPPIIFVDHNDHLFWLGAQISDLVVNLRESGLRLSKKHRNIAVDRVALLPTIVEPSRRVLSRSEAKQQIGIDGSKILLLSIARTHKYRTIDGLSFADAHVPLLKQHPQAILVVIGAGSQREDWAAAIAQVPGQIIPLAERADTAAFYQAADIYVDSFPFVSITSLLEAGCYGVPLVSRYPYPSDASEIFGADMPGLTGNLMREDSLAGYTVTLSQLVEDAEFRHRLGEKTQQKIIDTHTGDNWLAALEQVYAQAVAIPRTKVQSTAIDQMSLAEPDIFVPGIHGGELDLEALIEAHLTIMPLQQRLNHWLELRKKQAFKSGFGRWGQLRLLVPEWLYCRYLKLRYGSN
jgi:glycosyltransferase involved in cell wall biosynthesis